MEKNYILSKIKEYAEANEGKSPGKRGLEILTGIKESDWGGKYWVRWNDALMEAGLSPNELNTKLETDDVINHYIAFIREIGKFPVANEIKMRSRNNEDFPSHDTFARHMGNMYERAEFLKSYCDDKEGFDDIIALCDAKILSSPIKPQEQNADQQLDDATAPGFVYLLKSGKNYKIGKTNSVDRRQYEIGLQLAEPYEPIHSIETDDQSGIEAYWHNRFKDKRLNGEWFDLSASDVKAFIRRKFM